MTNLTPETDASGGPLRSSKLLSVAEAATPLRSSAGNSWRGFLVEHFHLRPVELPERPTNSSSLTLQLSPPTLVEWDDGGRTQRQWMTPGDVSLHPPGVLPGFRLHGEVELLQVTFDPLLLTQAVQEKGASGGIELIRQFGGQDFQIQRIALALKTEMDDGCQGGRLLGESLATALAAYLLVSRGASFPFARTACLSPADLRRALSHIEENLADDLSLAALAAAVHLSPSHFQVLFKRSTGLPVHRYVTQQRVERARHLLCRHPDLSVGRIAQLVGFYDQAHLTNHMRRLLHVTPASLRRL